jgi:hypothetical protein
MNFSFKIFSKCVTNRLVEISDSLIATNPTAFIRGRFILESIVSAHEIIHDVVQRKESGLVFKLYYEKAYDRVDRGFLIDMMEHIGFSPGFMKLIKPLLQKGSVGVRINDMNFESSRGLGRVILPLPFFSISL